MQGEVKYPTLGEMCNLSWTLVCYMVNKVYRALVKKSVNVD